MRAGSLICLAVLVALPVACGGRFERGEGDDGGGTSTSGGAGSNQGASSSTGAKPGKAGAASTGGSVAVGGGVSTTAGTGAVGTGGSCACPDFDCGPGFFPVPNPDGCCFHCEPFGMPCPGIACGPGSHLEHLPGQMCPTCVADSCLEQRNSYEAFKSQLLEKYSSIGCMVHEDCTMWWEKNQCAVSCGIPIPVSALNNLESNLQSYAQQTCSPMCQVDLQPCETGGGTPECVSGRCKR